MQQKRVSLVLGSGGARGLAHVGIIKWLEEHDYKIESISGCSIGALIGGFYAAGKLDIYVDWIQKLDIFDMLKLLDFKGSGGLISGDTLMEKMHSLVGDCLIEDLSIKFTAVASDIDSEKEIWINKGSLLNAIRASISLPLFFTPYLYQGRYLVDGGVLNPVPIAPTFNDNTDLTIAVNLGGSPASDGALKNIKKELDFSEKIKKHINKITIPESVVNETGMYNIANKSFDSMQGAIARMKLSAYPPDIELEIPRNLCGMFDFNKANEIIEYGYNFCEKIFAEIENNKS
ncbi:MAG: serine protease [Sulfurimonas sp.]|jgi:NTE family protein|nr:serine protease [Sulfurimonas sp.]MBU1217871.1 patatin-like phospholipase family protein [bacterium]MBU1433330.1 patatin-like phospholipase family protein [bacterium]MBU1503444.1 patatin-like phospholipase family protein [bacterium]MBU3938071.1 patatin-like phospholipase family protein [bacterium]